ncbi:MAG: radical SAM protein, partial [Candidatus Omnitrophica bacterium]|nr:radical SAM protein [Candidatus Omnitrophota bacterium]
MANSAYSIDTHKLIYHVDRVNRWLKGENIYPIYIEAAPAGGCNQRCVFCGLDYTGHKAKFLNTQCWQTFVKQAAKRGLRSVLFAGEGEPLLNKDINIFVESSKRSGIDTAIATNAFLLSNDLAKVILKNLTWIRVSLDAATAKVYSKIHGVNPEQFSIVLNNLSSAVELKKKYKYPVTIGVQFLLLKENYNDVLKAAAICRDLGADYFSVKPYSKHPLSLNEAGTEVDYSKW